MLTGTSGGGRDSAPRPSGTSDRAAVDSGSETKGPDSLPAVGMTISQPQLDAYALASGDHNPLHLDAGFAAATQFQGIIAHGMLTLASISQMMEVHLGKSMVGVGAPLALGSKARPTWVTSWSHSGESLGPRGETAARLLPAT